MQYQFNPLQMSRGQFPGAYQTLRVPFDCPVTAQYTRSLPVVYHDPERETPLLRKLQFTPSHPAAEYEYRFFSLLARTTMATDADSTERILPRLENLEFTKSMPGSFFDWGRLPDLFGHISQLNDPNRRPLNRLQVSWPLPRGQLITLDTIPEEYLFQERDLRRLHDLQEAGVAFDFRDPFFKFDIMKISMNRHRIGHS